MPGQKEKQAYKLAIAKRWQALQAVTTTPGEKKIQVTAPFDLLNFCYQNCSHNLCKFHIAYNSTLILCENTENFMH